MSKKSVKIQTARFAATAMLGKAAEMTNALSKDARIDSGPVNITFDPDPRFIRIECVATKEINLVPLSNVASLSVVEE